MHHDRVFKISGTCDLSGHSKHFHLKDDLSIGLNLVVINSKKSSETFLVKYIILIKILIQWMSAIRTSSGTTYNVLITGMFLYPVCSYNRHKIYKNICNRFPV